MNERQVANMALELADEFANRKNWKLINYIHWSEQSEDMLRSQQKYINLLHKLLNANVIGSGRNLLTGEVIPFEVEDEQ